MSDAVAASSTTEAASPDLGVSPPGTGELTGADSGGATEDAPVAVLEEEGEVAADYLEALLDVADLDGDIDMDVENGRAMVAVLGEDLGHLSGPDGKVLEALQELTRLAVQQRTGERSRLMLDVGGFRARRRTELAELAGEAVEEVRRTGEPRTLSPMTPFERKCVHDVVASAGLSSESEGEEPERRVVVLPA